MAKDKIQSLEQGTSVLEYLRTGTTGRIYMEGSKFKEKEPHPKRETTKPRAHRRL
jgi:hypothetical protein